LRAGRTLPYALAMRLPDSTREREAAQKRTLTLLDAAANRFPDQPVAASAWLNSPHAMLFGVTPAAAAWASEPLARYATWLLEYDAWEERVPERWPSHPNDRLTRC
jgi:hypothetical protein